MDRRFGTGLAIGVLTTTVVALAIALAVVLGGEEDDGAAMTTTTTDAATTDNATTEAGTTTTTATGRVEFRSPSGNIVCAVTPEATCGITEFDYSTPPIPADCTPEVWGHTISIGGEQAAGFVCAGDPPAAQAPVLAYDDGIILDPFVCGSGQDGVRCANRDSIKARIPDLEGSGASVLRFPSRAAGTGAVRICGAPALKPEAPPVERIWCCKPGWKPLQDVSS